MITILLPHLAVCALLILVSIPLILNRVGPNNYYGVRTTRTLGTISIWYKVNHYGGWAILIAAATGAASVTLAGMVMPALVNYSVLLVLAPLVVALGKTLSYASRVN